MFKENNVLVLIGIGCILGWFMSQLSYLQFGENGLWGLTISGIAFLFLGLLYKVNHKPSVEKKEPIDKEKKTIVKRIIDWRK